MACCSFITLGSGSPLWQSLYAQCWTLENTFNPVCCAHTARPMHTFITEALSQCITRSLRLKPDQAAPIQTLGNIHSRGTMGSSIRVENSPRREHLVPGQRPQQFLLQSGFLLCKQYKQEKWNNKWRKDTEEHIFLKDKREKQHSSQYFTYNFHYGHRKRIGVSRQNALGWLFVSS